MMTPTITLLSLLTLEPRAILIEGGEREGGRGREMEGVGDKIMSCII